MESVAGTVYAAMCKSRFKKKNEDVVESPLKATSFLMVSFKKTEVGEFAGVATLRYRKVAGCKTRMIGCVW